METEKKLDETGGKFVCLSLCGVADDSEKMQWMGLGLRAFRINRLFRPLFTGISVAWFG